MYSNASARASPRVRTKMPKYSNTLRVITLLVRTAGPMVIQRQTKSKPYTPTWRFSCHSAKIKDPTIEDAYNEGLDKIVQD